MCSARVSGKIDLIGHSFVRRLSRCVHFGTIPTGRNESPFSKDFGMDDVQVRFFGKLPNGRNLGYVRDALELAHCHLHEQYSIDPPYAVVLHVGGNDADHCDFDVHLFLSTLEEFLRIILLSGVERIVICSVFPRYDRRGGSHSYEANRQAIHVSVRRMVASPEFRQYLYFYQWSDRRFTGHLWSQDGVHLNDLGIMQYYHQVRNAFIMTRSMPWQHSILSEKKKHRPGRKQRKEKRYIPY